MLDSSYQVYGRLPYCLYAENRTQYCVNNGAFKWVAILLNSSSFLQFLYLCLAIDIYRAYNLMIQSDLWGRALPLK